MSHARRTLLTAIAGASLSVTAGCLGDTIPSGDNDDVGADNSGDDVTTNNGGNGDENNSKANETTARRLSLVSVDNDPFPLSFDIEVITEEWSDTEVPTLDIAVDNLGNETTTWTQSGSEFAFPQRHVEDGIGIGLQSEVTPGLLDRDGCARMEYGVGRDDVVVTTELAPGDSIEQRYAIAGVDSDLDEACPPSGTYRAEYVYGDLGEWGGLSSNSLSRSEPYRRRMESTR